MTGTKLLMNFEVTPTSHCLADYRARGGYATLDKVLREMRPEEVTKEVATAGILGHGGAAFPAGRWHLQACRNLSCSLRGGEGVIAHLERRLGIEPGQTTPDGRYTLSTVECLASCGTAPVLMVNETYHEDMSPERLDALLESLSR